MGQTVNGPGDDVLCSSYAPPHLFTVDQWRSRPEDRFPQPTSLPPAGHREPISSRNVSQELRILPDGTRVCGMPNVSIFYMDSSGRRRSESNFAVAGPEGKPIPTRAEIQDPVAGTLYYLDLIKHTAYRLHPPPPFRPPPSSDRPVQQPLPAITQNNQTLGTHMFEGFPVEGILHTTSGTPLGGSQPITVTTETWTYQGEIPTALLTKISNPRVQQTTALLNFTTAEPDPALFRVPDGWNVVEGEIRQPGLIAGGPLHTTAGFHYYISAGARTSYDYVVQEAPYSAERITERTNSVLATTNQERLYRDSAGRTRVERQLSQQYGDKDRAPVFTEITDPVDGVLVVLDPAHRTAHRFALPHMEQSPRLHTFSPNTARGTIESVKDLGENTMEGVTVSGELETWRTPAGTAGNDHEYTQSSESWYSTKLKLILLEKTHSMTDDAAIRLTHFSQAEPNHSLFEIPAGYTVVDEKRPVAITVVQP
jgi:hypothetical protein